MVQLIKCPTLNLGSALGLRVVSLSPMWVSMLGMQPIFKKKVGVANLRQTGIRWSSWLRTR